ncbi:hypothetical protein LTR04_002678 [Oleoguttula sp. CCFEE 6159]|nr:hypothetical protein LTR04_002678 [Oleoguttula sp. CCFEE 6159]
MQPDYRAWYPDRSVRRDASSWVALVEPLLPPQLRSSTPQPDTKRAKATLSVKDIPHILLKARRSYDVDILGCLGVEQGRWRAVVWIVKCLVEHPVAAAESTGTVRPLFNVSWRNAGSLDEATEHPILAEHTAAHDLSPRRSLDELTDTSAIYSRGVLHVRREALGQVWRSLGNMILSEARSQRANASSIMPHVLETIAYLHHVGIVPESTYAYVPTQDNSALQQPPTLHLLSSRILTSLSDAAWRAHELLVAEEANATGAQYTFLSHEIPGARSRLKVTELGPEVWLELVLWSCLHGGWVMDGVAIIEAMRQIQDTGKWSLVCWRDILNSSGTDQLGKSAIDWGKLQNIADANTRTARGEEHRGDRLRVERTISSEVVAAYVDALISTLRVGVGKRGTVPGTILLRIKLLKAFLEDFRMGLGNSSWDAIIVRFVESQGIDIERDPGMMEGILDLSPSFGQELESVNAPLELYPPSLTPTYVLDGSAAALGLLHRTLRAYIEANNVGGALRTFRRLQVYTDDNKERSLKQFFREMKDRLHSQDADGSFSFESNFSGIEYPGFHPQFPVNVLGPLLDLVTDAKAYQFGRWLLDSKDIDGPVVSESLYSDRGMAPSLIRFATATQDKSLLLKVTKAQSGVDGGKASPLPANVLLAFLDSQIVQRNWTSVENILEFMGSFPDYAWNYTTLAFLVKSMLHHRTIRHPTQADEQSLSKAATIFGTLLQGRYNRARAGRDSQLNCILGVLSSVNPAWARFCLGLRPLPAETRLDLPTSIFNILLKGVVDAYGSSAGKRLWDIWCGETIPPVGKVKPSGNGGVSTMPRRRSSPAISREDSVTVVPLGDNPGSTVTFRGRFAPSLSTLRVIVQKALEEQRQAPKQEALSVEDQTDGLLSDPKLEIPATQHVLAWAAGVFRSLGLREDDIERELGSLSVRGDTMLPTSSPDTEETVHSVPAVDVNEARML